MFDGSEVVYVGQSSDIYRRIYEHSSGRAKGEKKTFDSWEYIEIEDERTRSETEYILIKALKPKYNIDTKCRPIKFIKGQESDVRCTLSKAKMSTELCEHYFDSVSLHDVDNAFCWPNGSTYQAILEGKINREDVVIGPLGLFRVKNELFFRLLGNYIKTCDTEFAEDADN